MKRNSYRLVIALLCAANVALAVVLWRSPDPGYRVQEIIALGRYSEHDALIAETAKKYGVDPLLVKSVVWRESRFNATKTGTSGERGLMQVGEAAARDWAAAHKIEVFVYADLFDAKTNIEAGTWYLSRALEHWRERDDSIPFALAEYNAGRSRVEKWAAEGANARAMLRAASGGSARQYVDDVIRRYQRYLAQKR
ncbi:MAG: transglycosylase SLT domain-containing protein [Chthoniobacteraceae bacterium]